jgi:hypothetical protein
MPLSHWTRLLPRRWSRPAAPYRRSARPRLEALEDRVVPAVDLSGV